jgi:hypothetical protein
MTTCKLNHGYDEEEYESCPFCAHLDDEMPEPDIDVGDSDHRIIVKINTETTEKKGEPCII